MSIIYSAISILFFASTISASIRIVAPRDVYSAVIHNKQNSPIQCNIIWSPSSSIFQNSFFTIEQNKNHFISEQQIDMGTWKARASIVEIDCGDLSLKAPFDGVNSPKTNWDFFVYPNEIVSGSTSSNIQNY